jgi:phenylalanyl-tRNA synthetase alpha chain
MQFSNLREQFLSDLEQAKDLNDIETLRIRYLGRAGLVTQVTKGLDFRQMSDEERRAIGKAFNDLKGFAEARLAEVLVPHLSSQASGYHIDFTLSATDRRSGSLHPISLVQLELEEILHGMGFMVLTGFEVETENYNFNALNIPADHPARDMQDTYWLTNGMLLRTHTSANQVRVLEKFGAPVRVAFPGRCFRRESVDASHENTFYQLEGFLVDEEVSIANLIAVMQVLLNGIFYRDVIVRLRPGFFPFVEPGFELDIQCLLCNGSGCQTCKSTGWIELLPCGMVHPKVLQNGGVDPDRYGGFAFGLGLTRLAMMKFGIPEIRLFNSGDLRFYEQFPSTL